MQAMDGTPQRLYQFINDRGHFTGKSDTYKPSNDNKNLNFNPSKFTILNTTFLGAFQN